MSSNNRSRPRRRGSIFFPLLLIVLGVVFLLDTMGVIAGDFWSLIWQLWPILLIVIGLDSIFKREGLVGATFLIGLGILFLLANFGYLSVGVWQLVLTLWPVLLIAIGFDILVGRRSMWASLVGFIIVLGILIGALWLFGVSIETGQVRVGEAISQELNGASQASMQIEAGAGDIRIEALQEEGVLVSGTVPGGNQGRVLSSYTVTNGVGRYQLREPSGTFVIRGTQNQWTWDLGLTEAIPLDLSVQLGAGSVDADLSGLTLESISGNMGVGRFSFILPEEGRLDAELRGAIGQIVIQVPEGMEVRIDSDIALASIQVPEGYIRLGNTYKSPGYDSAESRVDVSVGMAIGNVAVREAR